MTEPDIKKSVHDMLTEAHNMGIDHCVQWIKEKNGVIFGSPEHEILSKLISEFEALKKS